MKKFWSSQNTLVAIIEITCVGLLLWLSLLVLLWWVLSFLGISVDFWGMTESLSTAVAAAAVLGAGYIAYRELSEISSSRHMEVADRLFQELNSAENIEARRWIYQNLPPDPQDALPTLAPEGRHAIKKVLNSLDRVAFLTQAGWIPEEIIMPWMHPMIAKCWEKLEPYVQYEIQRRNEPYYYQHARYLAERTRLWRSKHLPEVKINWVDDAL